MVVTFFRSSSFSSWTMCPFAYTLEWVFGFPGKANQSADLGSIFHKAVEVLAHKKLAQQNGETLVREEETGGEWHVDEITPESAIEIAWDHYTKNSEHVWTEEHRKTCHKLMKDTLSFSNGAYDPRNRKIVCPEQYFSFPIEKPWAAYEFALPDGRVLEGYLGLKGTIDLVVAVDGHPNTIELCDWKTGARKDWSNGKVKEYKDLRDDAQLRLYHYALSHLYPEAEEIFVTIVFCKDGGPYSLPFTKDDLPKTEEMVRRRFEEIRNTQWPKPVKGTPREWVKTYGNRCVSKCQRLCTFGTQKQPGTDKTICDFMQGEIQSLGLNKAMAKHADLNAIGKYRDGGGVTNREN